MQALIALALEGRDASPALEARYRYLAVQGFPPMPRTGRGVRLEYGASETIGAAVALELARDFVAPATAVEIVLSGWPEIAAAFARLAAATPTAASEWIEFATLADRSDPEPATRFFVRSRVTEASSSEARAGPRTVLSLDARALLAALVAAFGTDDVAAARFLEDLRRAIEAPVGDEMRIRLDDRDFYWPRAVDLLSLPELETAPGRQDREERIRLGLRYLLDPLPRERAARDDEVEGEAFGFWLRLLAQLRGGEPAGISPVDVLRAHRALGPSVTDVPRHLRTMLVKHAHAKAAATG